MKENSYILHCYDNLVAMATSNNCIFSLAVYSSLSPCIMCVQYCGGVQYHGGYLEYCGGYLEYHGEYHEYRGGVQYSGGYHDARGGIS